MWCFVGKFIFLKPMYLDYAMWIISSLCIYFVGLFGKGCRQTNMSKNCGNHGATVCDCITSKHSYVGEGKRVWRRYTAYTNHQNRFWLRYICGLSAAANLGTRHNAKQPRCMDLVNPYYYFQMKFINGSCCCNCRQNRNHIKNAYTEVKSDH